MRKSNKIQCYFKLFISIKEIFRNEKLRKEVRINIGFYLSLKYDIKSIIKNYKFNKCFLYVNHSLFLLSPFDSLL